MKKQQNNSSFKGSKDNKAGNNQNAPSSSVKQQFKKLSEYGKQLAEKQKVKKMYGLREKQFRIFFKKASASHEATGKALLLSLESRLDNIIYRLKFTSTRLQARKLIVHGHFLVNNKRVFSPSILLKINDFVSLSEKSKNNTNILKDIVDKNFSTGAKVVEWLELDKSNYLGRILRMPVREDIQATINENSIVELYSKN